MKRILIGILLLGLSAGISAQNDYNQVDKKGYKQGKWKKLYRSGKTYYEGEFKDNYEVGEFLYYHKNGNLKTKNTFSNQGKYCVSEGFFESGRPMYKGIYLNKQKDSVWNYFQEKTGKIIAEQRYEKGERIGTWYTFNDHGDTIEYTSWKNDKKNGPWYTIYENGYVKGNYKDSRLEGLYQDYYFEGTIKEQGTYSNGEKNGGWDYYSNNGSKLRFESWRDGEMRDRILYVRDGNELKNVSIYDVAYFYKDGSNTILVTFENEKITYDKSFETTQSLLGMDYFLLLNQNQQFAVHKNTLKQAHYDKTGEVIGITMIPIPEVNIPLDENGRKTVKAFFLPDLED